MRARAIGFLSLLVLPAASTWLFSCGNGSKVGGAGHDGSVDSARGSTDSGTSGPDALDSTLGSPDVAADSSGGDTSPADSSGLSDDSSPADTSVADTQADTGDGSTPDDSGLPADASSDTASGDASDGGQMTVDAAPDAADAADAARAVDSGCVPPGIDAGSITADVVQHHKNATRDGVFIDPGFLSSAATGLHLDSTFAGVLNGPVYAQPLWVENGPAGAEAFIVATETNHVTAIGSTGTTIWDKTFGAPNTGGLPCGNINPLGITGTPYVDAVSRAIYFDAMTTGPTDADASKTGPAHMVYAISLDDGSTKAGWPINVNTAVTGFDSSHQNERGALQLVNGILYVPFGGLDGDCDPYHGWVVGIPVATPGTGIQWWATSAARGGIWGPGALPSDGTYVYPVTGNTEGASTWGGGEAVVRLSAGPAFSGSTTDYYAPANWTTLDGNDQDLGGASNFLFDMSCAAFPHLVAAPGKDSNLYLLNRDDLGGIGGELSKTSVASGELKAAGAAYHTALGTYLALYVNGASGINCPNGRNGNLVVVKISTGNPPIPTVAWCSKESGLGSPIVTTTDGYSSVIVWDANNRLYGYDGDTGTEVYTGGGPTDKMNQTMQYFNSFIETKSRIAIAVQNRLYVFR
jgi:hypothetical protein